MFTILIATEWILKLKIATFGPDYHGCYLNTVFGFCSVYLFTYSHLIPFAENIRFPVQQRQIALWVFFMAYCVWLQLKISVYFSTMHYNFLYYTIKMNLEWNTVNFEYLYLDYSVFEGLSKFRFQLFWKIISFFSFSVSFWWKHVESWDLLISAPCSQ